MSEAGKNEAGKNEAGPRRTEAETRRSRWPGWIWAVPIAAVGVAAWLGVSAIAKGGEGVTVSFDTAEGVKAGDTKVRDRGVQVGEVSGVTLSPDGERTEVRLRLDRTVDKDLKSGTRFWLIGASPSLTDPSSIKSLISGTDIGMEPGPGAPARSFKGLDKPPAIQTATKGTAFVLTSDSLGSLSQGSGVYASGQEVGKITAVHWLAPHRFTFDVLVRAPYDRTVTAATRFWNASAVEVSAAGSGVKAELVSPAALLAGGVGFDTAAAAAAAPAGSTFPLFADKETAQDAPDGPQVPYLVRFTGAVGDLKPGAAVELRGFRVGEVTGVKLAYDARTGALETPTTLELEPGRLDIRNAGPSRDPRASVDAMLSRLIARGLRASLSQSPPVVGGREITLDFVDHTPPARLEVRGGAVEIPSASSGDVASIERKADQAMTKVNLILAKADAVPIAAIGDNVRAITGRIRGLVSSPEIKDTLDHVDRTVAEVDRAVHQIAPQIPPLVAKLREVAGEADDTVQAVDRLAGGQPASQDSDLPAALRELTDAARSIRALADQLEEHPESLIKGKGRPGKSR